MIRMLAVFGVVFVFVWGAIELWKLMTKQEKWALIKTLGYSTMIASITTVILSVIVILF